MSKKGENMVMLDYASRDPRSVRSLLARGGDADVLQEKDPSGQAARPLGLRTSKGASFVAGAVGLCAGALLYLVAS